MVLVCQRAQAVTNFIIRATTRLDPDTASGDSPTNELMRHLLLVLLLSPIFGFSIEPVLIAVFLVNAVSMLVPYKMTTTIRAQAKSSLTVGALTFF